MFLFFNVNNRLFWFVFLFFCLIHGTNYLQYIKSFKAHLMTSHGPLVCLGQSQLKAQTQNSVCTHAGPAS